MTEIETTQPKKAKKSKTAKRVPAVLHVVLVGPMTVQVKYRGVSATHYGNALTQVHVQCAGGGSAQFELADKLRELATFFAGSSDAYGGSADIVILRRKS